MDDVRIIDPYICPECGCSKGDYLMDDEAFSEIYECTECGCRYMVVYEPVTSYAVEHGKTMDDGCDGR